MRCDGRVATLHLKLIFDGFQELSVKYYFADMTDNAQRLRKTIARSRRLRSNTRIFYHSQDPLNVLTKKAILMERRSLTRLEIRTKVHLKIANLFFMSRFRKNSSALSVATPSTLFWHSWLCAGQALTTQFADVLRTAHTINVVIRSTILNKILQFLFIVKKCHLPHTLKSYKPACFWSNTIHN